MTEPRHPEAGLLPRRQIPVNTLHRSGGATVALDQMLGVCNETRLIREAASGQLSADLPDPGDLLRNLAEISERTIRYEFVLNAFGNAS